MLNTRRNLWFLPVLFLIGSLPPGCGGAASESGSFNAASAPISTNTAGGGEAAADRSTNEKSVAPAKTVERKIVYTATVDLAADNLPKAQETLLALVKRHHGYVAEMNVSGAAGTPREGMWKVRVPVDEFTAFMDAVAKIAELRSVHTNSQDVTAEYYDAQAHLTNKRAEEQRLLRHLDKSTGKLSDILEIEHELSRVRGEIEELQGRLQLLANTATLSTVTVTIHEAREFVPKENPTFSERIAQTFHVSVIALRDVVLAIVLFIVAILPWLVASLLVLLPVWLIVRHMEGKKRA